LPTIDLSVAPAPSREVDSNEIDVSEVAVIAEFMADIRAL